MSSAGRGESDRHPAGAAQVLAPELRDDLELEREALDDSIRRDYSLGGLLQRAEALLVQVRFEEDTEVYDDLASLVCLAAWACSEPPKEKRIEKACRHLPPAARLMPTGIRKRNDDRL